MNDTSETHNIFLVYSVCLSALPLLSLPNDHKIRMRRKKLLLPHLQTNPQIYVYDPDTITALYAQNEFPSGQRPVPQINRQLTSRLPIRLKGTRGAEFGVRTLRRNEDLEGQRLSLFLLPSKD